MPPKHHRDHSFVEIEEEFDLKTIGEQLQNIGARLAAKGRCTINQTEVIPSDPCELRLRYGRLPEGEEVLKIELVWEPADKRRREKTTKGLQIED